MFALDVLCPSCQVAFQVPVLTPGAVLPPPPPSLGASAAASLPAPSQALPVVMPYPGSKPPSPLGASRVAPATAASEAVRAAGPSPAAMPPSPLGASVAAPPRAPSQALLPLAPSPPVPPPPPSQALLAAAPCSAAGPPVLLVASDRDKWILCGEIDDSKVFELQKAMEFRMMRQKQEYIDLTELSCAVFDWRTYLLHRRDYAYVIGTGVVEFRIQRFSDWCTDFVVLRSDGSAARIPGLFKRSRHMSVVIGRLEDWRSKSDGALRCTNEDASRFLQRIDDEWALCGFKGPYFREVSEDEFPGRKWLQQGFAANLVGERVHRFGIACYRGKACFVGATVDGHEFSLARRITGKVAFYHGVSGVTF